MRRKQPPTAARNTHGFGDAIREEREKCGMTKADAAKAIGVAWTTLNDWEAKRALPSARKVKMVISAYGLSASEDATLMATYERDLPMFRRVVPAPEGIAWVQKVVLRAVDPDVHSIEDVLAASALFVSIACERGVGVGIEDAARAVLDAARALRLEEEKPSLPAVLMYVLRAQPRGTRT